MKKIFYPVLLLVLAACKNPEQTSETIVPAPAIADIPTDTVTTQVDGITSATSKPNQVSFNGTIVLPPQRQATVALTMGGVVKHTSLLPGQQVRQGALLATLENPTSSHCNKPISTAMPKQNICRPNMNGKKLSRPNKPLRKRSFNRAKQTTYQ